MNKKSYDKLRADPVRWAMYLDKARRYKLRKAGKPEDTPIVVRPKFNAKENAKKYYLKNKDKIFERSKIWKKRNPEKVKESSRKYRLKNKEKNRDYWRKRRLDPNNRMLFNLRNRLYAATRGMCFSETTKELLGCKMEELRTHIESKFKDGMTWENYGSYWHVDHIIPCSLFDLSLESGRIKCFNYKNLQPLGALENILKSNKLIYNG